jgi:hypothetical protein
MSTKTQFIGPISSGILRGNPALDSSAHLRFTTITTIEATPVSGLRVLDLPSDGVLSEIAIITRAALPGEAVARFGSTTTPAAGSDNIGSVTLSARGRYVVPFSATALATTLPLGRAPMSALPTPIFYSRGATSGAVTALTGAIIECTYTRLPLSDDPTVTPSAGHVEQNTRYRGPITSGVDRGFGPGQNPIGYAELAQYTTVRTAPVTGQVVGCIAPGAKLDEIEIYMRVSLPGEAQLRFAVNNNAGSDNLGAISVSAAGKYSLSSPTALVTLPFGVNNTGSALPVYVSIVPTSGVASTAANNIACDLRFTRYGEKAGYPGDGQKETNFRQALASGLARGQTDKSIGYARFTQLTTVGTNTTGVLSSVQIGVLPFGAFLSDISYNLRGALGGEMRTRVSTVTGSFASDNLGSASLSAAGRYSLLQATAITVLPGYVNRTGAELPLYLSTLSLSGSISNMTANSVIELTYVRLDPTQFGG